MNAKWWILLGLVGCGDAMDTAVQGSAPPPGVPDLYVGPMRVGRDAQVYVGPSPAQEGALTYIAASVAGPGAGPCPAALGGTCVDMLQPVLAMVRRADDNGQLGVPLRIPASTPAGSTVCIQAFQEVTSGPMVATPVVCGVVDACNLVQYHVDFTQMGNVQGSEMVIDHFAMSASNGRDLNIVDQLGLGVVGGDDGLIDDYEAVMFSFFDDSASDVSYTIADAIDLDGNGVFGERARWVNRASGSRSWHSFQDGDGTVSFGSLQMIGMLLDAYDGFRVTDLTYSTCQ